MPVSVCGPRPGPVPGPGPEAAHVITAFSRPGELVVIPAGTGALLTAAAAAGRRVLGLFSGPAACHAASARLDRDLGPAARPLAQARAGGPGLLLEAGCPEAGRAALAITGRDGPGGGVLYTACERVLRPGGVLAVITASTPRPAGLRDDPGEVIAAARAAGLIYAQHIVALHAAITDGQLTPAPRAPPARTRPPAPRPSAPASTATCSCSPSPEEPRDEPPPPPAPPAPRTRQPGPAGRGGAAVGLGDRPDRRPRAAPRPVPARRHRPPRQDAARDRRHRHHPLQRARGPGRRPDVRHRHHPGRGHPPGPRRDRRGVRAPVGAPRRREHHPRPPPRRDRQGGGDPR